jgi:nitrate reductase NapD
MLMPISGVVIKCRPECTAHLEQTLARPDSVEIHGTLPDGSLIAVIEADSVEEETRIVMGLLETDGVIDVRLAYHNFEDINNESDSNGQKGGFVDGLDQA